MTIALFSTQPSSGKLAWLRARPQGQRDNHSVLYTRLPRLSAELDPARGYARLASWMKSIAAVELLILDHWGLQAIDANTVIICSKYLKTATAVDPHRYQPASNCQMA
ncbi:ATP-binding protein [Bradyrhizobium cytisi]|uniref:ATP-binding protein n=1 Tax=Bradyrhizobium cytisi TaxID=515489 RepID=UPI001FE25EBB|nr:ATP-binding protein [Bradyrhizobium cytisi]